jgi:aspartyl-tRNA(Asn)/glutamyl-tRNA(Gln) amidotransferase subunit B
MGSVKSYLNENGVEIQDFPIKAEALAELIDLIDEGHVSSTIASQKIFPEMLSAKESAKQIAERMNLIQVSDEDELVGFIDAVIAGNPSESERFKNGEQQLIGFFMGQLMRVSKGKADPKIANSLLRKKLNDA